MTSETGFPRSSATSIVTSACHVLPSFTETPDRPATWIELGVASGWSTVTVTVAAFAVFDALSVARASMATLVPSAVALVSQSSS